MKKKILKLMSFAVWKIRLQGKKEAFMWFDGQGAKQCIAVRNIADFLSRFIFFTENWSTNFLENFLDLFSLSTENSDMNFKPSKWSWLVSHQRNKIGGNIFKHCNGDSAICPSVTSVVKIVKAFNLVASNNWCLTHE